MKTRMRKLDFTRARKHLKAAAGTTYKWIKAHKPQIKIVAGVGLMGGAIVVSSAAGRKSEQRIREAKEKKGEELTKREVIKVVGKNYIPTVGMAVGGARCIFSGSTDLLKRNAALVGRYNLSVENFKAYRDIVASEIGEKKMTEITEKIKSKPERVENDRPKQDHFSKQLWRIEQTGTFFYATLSEVEHAMTRFNGYLTSYRNVNERAYIDDLFEILKSQGAIGMFNTSVAASDYYWSQVDADVEYRTWGTGQTDKDDFPLEKGLPYNILEFLTPPRLREPWE